MPKITRHYRPSEATPVQAEPVPEREPEATSEGTDYVSLTKAELVDLANERGVPSAGTKQEIIERLEAQDGLGDAG